MMMISEEHGVKACLIEVNSAELKRILIVLWLSALLFLSGAVLFLFRFDSFVAAWSILAWLMAVPLCAYGRTKGLICVGVAGVGGLFLWSETIFSQNVLPTAIFLFSFFSSLLSFVLIVQEMQRASERPSAVHEERKVLLARCESVEAERDLLRRDLVSCTSERHSSAALCRELQVQCSTLQEKICALEGVVRSGEQREREGEEQRLFLQEKVDQLEETVVRVMHPSCEGLEQRRVAASGGQDAPLSEPSKVHAMYRQLREQFYEKDAQLAEVRRERFLLEEELRILKENNAEVRLRESCGLCCSETAEVWRKYALGLAERMTQSRDESECG